MKKYFNLAFLYLILALVGGVFYREFTKFNNYVGDTTLSIVHVHYFVLGFIMNILLFTLTKDKFEDKKLKMTYILYNIGLNLTILMFIVKGIISVVDSSLIQSLEGMLAGLAGIGHIILGVSILLLLVFLRKIIFRTKEEA